MNVDPKALRRAQSATGETRGDFRSAALSPLDETAAAAGKVNGWQSAEGLKVLGQRWEQQVESLDAILRGLGERFGGSAAAYERTEAAVHGEMSRIQKAFG
ncbi:hypothetical protein ASE03_22715 [Kitasatospora sp. Root187]|nr:hypothetical protein ASC99_26155 [Kitasatospora sp. Root107]KRB72642.1 hypothetical protein ASE03_22715 [Kitasatospora sp. Root187]